MTHLERIEFFAAQDPHIAKIMTEIGEITPHREKDLFDAIISSLISQQLSTKAAATIYRRFKAYFNEILDPSVILATPEEELRSVGISRQKAAYIHDVCDHFLNQSELFANLESLENEQIIEQLTKIRGIGRWTAEMLLMFTLHRNDVFPVDDLGIQQAMINLYALEDKPSRSQLTAIAESWRPLRSWACFYLWKHRDMQK